MRNLDRTIQSLFYGFFYHGSHPNYAQQEFIPKVAFLEIPVCADSFEIPCFVLEDDSLIWFKDKIVVCLNTKGNIPMYTTLNAYMKEVLSDSFTSNRLVELTTETNGQTKHYYATAGAIFDDDFTPLLMCTVTVTKKCDDEVHHLTYSKPTVRINPDCYLAKDNPIEKFIAGKFIQTALVQSLSYSPSSHNRKLFTDTNIRVEIGEIPFKPKYPDVPSISTDNEALIQIAKEHIDDVINDN